MAFLENDSHSKDLLNCKLITDNLSQYAISMRQISFLNDLFSPPKISAFPPKKNSNKLFQRKY